MYIYAYGLRARSVHCSYTYNTDTYARIYIEVHMYIYANSFRARSVQTCRAPHPLWGEQGSSERKDEHNYKLEGRARDAPHAVPAPVEKVNVINRNNLLHQCERSSVPLAAVWEVVERGRSPPPPPPPGNWLPTSPYFLSTSLFIPLNRKDIINA